MGQATSAQPANAPGKSRRRLLLGVGVALLGLAVAVYGPIGWNAYQQKRLTGMNLPQLEQFAKAQPNHTEAQYRLGLAYSREGRYREATQRFLAVLEKEPTRAEVLNDLGVTYLLQDRYYESLVALEGAIQRKPEFAAAHANLGRLHLATKMPFTATKDLQKAVQLDPHNVATLCDLGEALQQTLNLQGAEEAYRKALAIDGRNAAAWVGLGKTLYSRGKVQEAEQALQSALQIVPDSAPALMTQARLILEQSGSAPPDLNRAKDLLQRALKTDPQNPDAWYDLGRISLRENNHTEAIEHLKKAILISPQYQAALQQMERALRLAGRTEDADRTAKVIRERALREREETRLEEHISHYPQDWDSQAKLAQLYILSGKQGLARLITLKLQQQAPQHPALPLLLRALPQGAGK